MTITDLPPLTSVTDNHLLAELAELEKWADQEATTDPASLLRHLNPRGYRRRPHLDIISGEIALLRQQVLDRNRMVGPRLLIEEPPQTGKTVTGVVGAAFWWLVRFPKARIVIGSYGDRLAIDRGKDISRLVERHGSKYGLKMARGSESKQDWRLESGGGIRSVGVGSGIAGTPADIIFIDDPHKSRQEADSPVSRDRVWNWYSADMTSRLAPGAPVVVVMTPWHPDDISQRLVQQQGRVENGGLWKVIRMPAFCDDPDRDPLKRKLGDPLPHPRIRRGPGYKQRLVEHWNGKRSGSTVQDWSALYMCDPQPTEGALLPRTLLLERRCYTTDSCDQKPKKSGVAVDPSGGGKDTAGIIGGHLGSDNRVYLTHDYSGVMPSHEWAKRACQMAVDIDADFIVFESNFGGDLAKLAIRGAWETMVSLEGKKQAKIKREARANKTLTVEERNLIIAGANAAMKPYRRLPPRIVSVTARKNKRLRAEPAAQQWVEDRVRTARYLPELEQEWATWQADLKDSPGRIDASVYLIYELLPLPGVGVSRKREPVQGSLPISSMSPLGSSIGASTLGPLG